MRQHKVLSSQRALTKDQHYNNVLVPQPTGENWSFKACDIQARDWVSIQRTPLQPMKPPPQRPSDFSAFCEVNQGCCAPFFRMPAVKFSSSPSLFAQITRVAPPACQRCSSFVALGSAAVILLVLARPSGINNERASSLDISHAGPNISPLCVFGQHMPVDHGRGRLSVLDQGSPV